MTSDLRDPTHLRLILDGPSGAGKTTTARSLGARLSQDVFTPDELPDGRTVLFDWMEYIGGRHNGKPIRTEVITVPGHLFDRRKTLLHSGDVILFVVDTTNAGMPGSVEAYQQLIEIVAGIENPPRVIVQANKRDTPDATPIAEVRRQLGLADDEMVIETNASNGDGVRQAFVYAVRLGLARLGNTSMADSVRRDLTAEELADILRSVTDAEGPSSFVQAHAVADLAADSAEEAVKALRKTADDAADAPSVDVTPVALKPLPEPTEVAEPSAEAAETIDADGSAPEHEVDDAAEQAPTADAPDAEDPPASVVATADDEPEAVTTRVATPAEIAAARAQVAELAANRRVQDTRPAPTPDVAPVPAAWARRPAPAPSVPPTAATEAPAAAAPVVTTENGEVVVSRAEPFDRASAGASSLFGRESDPTRDAELRSDPQPTPDTTPTPAEPVAAEPMAKPSIAAPPAAYQPDTVGYEPFDPAGLVIEPVDHEDLLHHAAKDAGAAPSAATPTTAAPAADPVASVASEPTPAEADEPTAKVFDLSERVRTRDLQARARTAAADEADDVPNFDRQVVDGVPIRIPQSPTSFRNRAGAPVKPTTPIRRRDLDRPDDAVASPPAPPVEHRRPSEDIPPPPPPPSAPQPEVSTPTTSTPIESPGTEPAVCADDQDEASTLQAPTPHYDKEIFDLMSAARADDDWNRDLDRLVGEDGQRRRRWWNRDRDR